MTFSPTPSLAVAVVAIIAFVLLAIFGTLSSTDAAGLIAGIVSGFGLGVGHAVTSNGKAAK